MNITDRSTKALNLGDYMNDAKPQGVLPVVANCPEERQYTLRMLIKEPFGSFQVPDELSWANEIIDAACRYQKKIVQVNHPFCYITVRHGLVESEDDDVWHVDGFSMRITHLPEQNYIWVNNHPTEYVTQRFYIPLDFDPDVHNLHSYLNSQVNTKAKTLQPNFVYCIDPYVVHRRPQVPAGTVRTFVRVSFTPIPIMDKNNSANPLLPNNFQSFVRDGVKDFRDDLIDYPIHEEITQ